MGAVAAFNAAHAGARCDSVEGIAANEGEIAAVARAVAHAVRGSGVDAYVEIPVADDPAPLVDVLAAHALRAKCRTGGITADAFPAAAQLGRFLGACIRAGLPFKLTAGLHHPLRGEYRLTYAPGSACGSMYGFLNAIVAAALLREGVSDADAEAVLLDADPAAFRFDDVGVHWRDRTVTTPRLRQLREKAMASIGSCSFTEPVDDLHALGLL
jgi:hypothetical protein